MTAPAADLDRRFYAFAVDRAIAWGLDALAAVLIVRALGPDQAFVAVVAVAGVVVVVGAAFAVVLGLSGSSPGNALVAIRVVDEDSGGPIGVSAALLRQLVLGVAALPMLGLGVAALAWTAAMDATGRRRGWHDHLVGSTVVDVRPAPAEEPVADDLRPRHVVNLTAMRLVPVPEPAPPVRVPRPASPPPAPPGPPAPAAAPAPAPAPRAAVPAGAAPAPSANGGRQRLGFPLLPEPRPDPAPAGAHAARPQPRWRLGFDSGESVVVEGPVLVGRRPEPRDGEQVAHLVPLRSEDLSLSKTHAQVRPTPNGTLVVVDRGSTNGSILIRHGVPRGLAPDRAATLLVGDRVRLGDREMTVDQVE